MAAALLLAGCATVPEGAAEATDHPEARAYAVTEDAMGDVDAALARAASNGKRVIVAMGANWCHDSRAFAGWLETPRFAALTERAFEVVYVNVGMPQTGDAHNLEVARRFGFETLDGTPTVLVLDADGTVLNADGARSWRNAASRSEDAIYAELEGFAAR
jgi:thioredoxin-like negative regulator of GroEL